MLGRGLLPFPYLVPLNKLRKVGFFQILGLLVSQLHLHSSNRLVNPLFAPQSNYWVDHITPQNPRGCYLRHLESLLLCDLLQAIDDCLVHLVLPRPNQVLQEHVRLVTRCTVITPGSRQDATCDGRPWNTADTGIGAVREHLTLFFAVDEVVIILHRDELVPVVLLGDVLQALELPGCHLMDVC